MGKIHLLSNCSSTLCNHHTLMRVRATQERLNEGSIYPCTLSGCQLYRSGVLLEIFKSRRKCYYELQDTPRNRAWSVKLEVGSNKCRLSVFQVKHSSL